MASLTIRNLDDETKARLRLRAARHGCSMEQEVRNILREAVRSAPADRNFATRIRQRFAGLEIDELPIPARRPARLPETPNQ